MPTQTYNTASVSFECGSQKGFVSSNIAVTTMQEVITATKSSLGETYAQKSEVPFIICVNNNSFEEVKNIKIQDDLGSYCLGQGICDSFFTPLTYVSPSMVYISGKFLENCEPKISQGKLEYQIKSIPAKSSALIFYKAATNEFSPLASGSKIKSTITVSGESVVATVTGSNIIKVNNSADIRIIKNMSPNPVLSGEKITYTFSLYNYGNTAATKVTLSDTFSPAPSDVAVLIDSVEVENSNFSYLGNTLTIPTINSDLEICVPAANFIADSVTGLISTQPGITTITVTGKI